MLEDKILQDYKNAMKDRDLLKVSVLSFLRAALKNAAIDKRKEKLDDMEVTAVLSKQVKQRRDSIEQFKMGGRMDLAEKETGELKVLESYLPERLSEDKIKGIIEEVISQTGAGSMKDMGLVMKELTPKIAGRADSKLVSQLVKERLSASLRETRDEG